MIEIRIGRTSIIVLALLILIRMFTRPARPARDRVERTPPPDMPTNGTQPLPRQFVDMHRN